ncbi:ankyrin repeat protein [Apiospora arundinis]|uniref:Ankyrin repeat protein n=1 Tax=Apiospora arundinis TaxID=335852 RepID=A0ABR2J9D0_9PEZI
MTATSLPQLPIPHGELAGYIADHPTTPITTLIQPYRQYEAHLRETFAQDRNNPILDDPYINVLPVFTQETSSIKTRARNLEEESASEKEKYIMSLPDDKRRPHGSPAVVQSLGEFRHNFSVFSEAALADIDWSNVVAAGSSVVNCLLPVPDKYKGSKRSLRQYYHEQFCPASDVDLFLYGLDERQAIEKIKQIETQIRDAILAETTVVRTKNAITICSQYPTRHVQIVLRVYKSVSEILTGFDIDCSGAAYDGQQVYCTPRALAAYITQINPVDLSRRSPSYENRLSKYSHRNFEVYWPELDRSRVDPTIFERSFSRTLGLARLLVLERLPTTNAREQYLRKRREERGRPALEHRYQYRLYGNIKEAHEDEVADWISEDDVSSYHTFTIPYGEKFHAKKIEKLCYTRDLLLNAEWNQPKEREVYLHRHPAFFGRVGDVVADCCGTCPKAVTPEEIEIAKKESEIYVSGEVSFRIDDPGRQQIGSFNPLTENDWTEMAYVGNTARLCQAIVDEDLDHVEDWLSQDGADPNQRDYTGRTPLHLAVTSSTPQIVKCLVDHGARLVPRLADGRTALHLAAARGSVEIVKILLEKSSENEQDYDEREDIRRKAREVGCPDNGNQATDGVENDEDDSSKGSDGSDEDDADFLTDVESDDEDHSVATGSFVKVRKTGNGEERAEDNLPLDDDPNDPDFYKIDIAAWDSHCSALHFAILGGHIEVVQLLCQEFAADVLSPVKFGDGSPNDVRAAILTLVLALALPAEKATKMAETLISLGATSSQAEAGGVTAFHRYVQQGSPAMVNKLWECDQMGLKAAINHVVVNGSHWNPNATTPLMTAIEREDPILVIRLLEAGSRPEVDFDAWLKGAKLSLDNSLRDYEFNQKLFAKSVDQPLVVAVRCAQPAIALELLKKGADPNVITRDSQNLLVNSWGSGKGQSVLDIVRSSLEALREYSGEKTLWFPSRSRMLFGHPLRRQMYDQPPKGPEGTEEFLRRFKEGTYQHLVVSTDIQNKVASYKHELERFQKAQGKIANHDGLKMKKEAIVDLVSQLEEVEEALLARDAKTFQQLHPNVQSTQRDNRDNNCTNDDDQKTYEYSFSFPGAKDVTETRKAAYIQLFEAAWSGDMGKIKSLTLSSWDADQKESPLQVAVGDTEGNNPFSLAFLKGHYEVAWAILEITQVQWAPSDERKVRYSMPLDVDEESGERAYGESEAMDPELFEEIIDGDFTIENIGQVSMQVKSNILPADLLRWTTPTFNLNGAKVEQYHARESLIHFAMRRNDQDKFRRLVEMGRYFTQQRPLTPDDEETSRIYTFPEAEFLSAIKLGRVDILSGAIGSLGAGIPLEHLVKKSGVSMQVKPRYYQGLTVYGKKRSDWANAGRSLATKATGSQVPPLLTAALLGSLASVEWFISDIPMRKYIEFGNSKSAKNDPRLNHLSQSPGGFDRAIIKWLGMQNDLVLHCAVMGPTGDETDKLIRYLMRVCPSSLEAKSDAGYTPLFLACLLGRKQFAQTLIEGGADQSVKDKQYNNIIHAALTNMPVPDKLREVLDLLDSELRSHLFVQRNHLTHGGNTPLHAWLLSENPAVYSQDYRYQHLYPNQRQVQEKSENINMLKLLLEYSGGQDLDILNGSGDTVAHSAVLRQLPEQMRVMLEKNPKGLHRENAVGRTPAEMAYDAFISQMVAPPRDVAICHNYSRNNVATTLVEDSPQAFLDKKNKDKLSRKERVWEVVQDFMARYPDKRRLVSLNEANDVARRLGENYSWQRYYTKQTKTDVEAQELNDEEKEEEDKKEEVDYITTQYAFKKPQAWGRNEPEKCADCGNMH